MTTPTVSVVMTGWNAEQFVDEAIRSVLAQTVPPGEVVFIDDGSTDGTAALAGSLDVRVHVERNAHEGVGSARAAGIALATGAFALGLAPREVSRKMKEYADREWPIPGPVEEGGRVVRCGQFQSIPPDFPAAIRVPLAIII